MRSNLINQNSTIYQALERLHILSEAKFLTLFVTDDSDRMTGTVTDGDIRRAILRGCSLECQLSEMMNRDFTWVEHDTYDIKLLRHIKAKGYKLVPVLDREHRIVDVLDFANHRSHLPIDAVLMAGGKGERLRPLTLTTPKPLLKVGEKPIIDYNIENLLQHGIRNIHVTVNYLAEQLEDHFCTPRTNGIQVKCIREPEYLGTMGSVKFVTEWQHDTILVMNSDLFTNIDLEDFFMHFKDHDADMSIAAVPYSVNIPYGIFELEGVREIKGVREKPTFHYYANAGIYLFRRSLLEMIPEKEFFNATDMMDKLISTGHKVIRFPLSGYWIDIGKPQDFQKVQDIAQHLHKS